MFIKYIIISQCENYNITGKFDIDVWTGNYLGICYSYNHQTNASHNNWGNVNDKYTQYKR